MALKSRAPHRAHGNEFEYRPGCERTEKRRIGIALSGGGIRSAAFNLGALQALQEQKVLEKSEFLAAVSGGSYVAGALQISQAHTDKDAVGQDPLWSHGSPEERHLRMDTNYLAPGFQGRVWLVLSVIYGFGLNYIPFLLGSFVTGRLLGWLVVANGMKLSDIHLDGIDVPASKVVVCLIALIAALLVVAVMLVAFRRFRDAQFGVTEFGKGIAERVATWLVVLAGTGAAMLILPALAKGYAEISGQALAWMFSDGTDSFQTRRGRLFIAGVWLLFALVLAAVSVKLSRRLRARRLMLALSAFSAAGLLLVPFLSSLDYSTSHGFSGWTDIITVGIAILVMLTMAVFVHNRRYSLHLFYRERLCNAFALKRVRNGDGTAAQPLNFTTRLKFSDIGRSISEKGLAMPKLIVCCAANVTSGEVPVGRFAESFTFEHDESGGPRFQYHPTSRFESGDRPKGTSLTLPSIMAVSGAALSPLMGRFTYPPLRFLMALTDIRLGVWVRNPKHESWEETPKEPTNRIGRFAALIRDGWREPGALYVLREAVGALSLKKRFIYLTDGGHWENLGMVELLRRRCTHLLCFDASADQVMGGQDIGRAMALARSELGVDVRLDPRPTMSVDDSGSDDSAVLGSVVYPDGQEGRLIYAKATLPRNATWDLHAFKSREGKFPNHSTSQQFFTDEQFEAYRSLGHAAGRRAVELLNLPPAQGGTAVRSVNGKGLPTHLLVRANGSAGHQP
jgi:hypothetical protein